jgi:hypothetical protein
MMPPKGEMGLMNKFICLIHKNIPSNGDEALHPNGRGGNINNRKRWGMGGWIGRGK